MGCYSIYLVFTRFFCWIGVYLDLLEVLDLAEAYLTPEPNEVLESLLWKPPELANLDAELLLALAAIEPATAPSRLTLLTPCFAA